MRLPMDGLQKLKNIPPSMCACRSHSCRDSFPPACLNKAALIPRPLFSDPTLLPPTTINTSVYGTTTAASPSSPTYSPPLSPPIMPVERGRLSDKHGSFPRSPTQTHTVPVPVICRWDSEWDAFTMPNHSLKRKKSPRLETLRSLRNKESEASLQKVYDQQLNAYLTGSMFAHGKWKVQLGCIEEQ